MTVSGRGRLTDEDAAALHGVVVVLAGQLMARRLDPGLVNHLRRRLVEAGLLVVDSGPEHVLQELLGLGERLRHVLGEYEEPPPPPGGSTDQNFRFGTSTDAESFAAAAALAGETVSRPSPIPDREGWWQVSVRVEELVLSDARDRRLRSLTALVDQHRGAEGGWSMPSGLDGS